MPDSLPPETPPAPVLIQEPSPTPRRSRLAALGREVLETVLPALLIALAINLFLGESRRVEMQSMEPTLYENQRVIVEKISYRLHPPRRGDIVVLRVPHGRPEPPLIKRVIGLPGETVEIANGSVLIDGQALDEPYLDQLTYQGNGPVVVPPDEVYVLGDNRGFSNDSRYFGTVPFSNIVGRAWLRYWPLSQIGLLH